MLLTGVSCVKEENQPVSPMTGNDDVPSFVAFGSQVDTKVSLMENGTSVNWNVGDLVAVLTEVVIFISSLLKVTEQTPSSAISLKASRSVCSTSQQISTLWLTLGQIT